MKVLLSFFVLLFAFDVRAADLVGTARALDGDTLVVAGTEVRLYGIDAPHLEQTCKTRKAGAQKCGVLAHQALSHLLRGPQVRCEDKGRAADGRVLATCKIGWMDLAEEMAASGWAMADPETGAGYGRAETFAKARKEGVWRTEFTPPWDWRGQ